MLMHRRQLSSHSNRDLSEAERERKREKERERKNPTQIKLPGKWFRPYYRLALHGDRSLREWITMQVPLPQAGRRKRLNTEAISTKTNEGRKLKVEWGKKNKLFFFCVCFISTAPLKVVLFSNSSFFFLLVYMSFCSLNLGRRHLSSEDLISKLVLSTSWQWERPALFTKVPYGDNVVVFFPFLKGSERLLLQQAFHLLWISCSWSQWKLQFVFERTDFHFIHAIFHEISYLQYVFFMGFKQRSTRGKSSLH